MLDPYEFNNSNTFNPEIYNDPFIFVVVFNIVNPLTFNDDNYKVISFTVSSFKVERPLTFKNE